MERCISRVARTKRSRVTDVQNTAWRNEEVCIVSTSKTTGKADGTQMAQRARATYYHAVTTMAGCSAAESDVAQEQTLSLST
jgi:hypothetical protein